MFSQLKTTIGERSCQKFQNNHPLQKLTFCDRWTDILTFVKTYLYPFITTVEGLNLFIMLSHNARMDNGAEEKFFARNAQVRKKIWGCQGISGILGGSKITINSTELFESLKFSLKMP